MNDYKQVWLARSPLRIGKELRLICDRPRLPLKKQIASYSCKIVECYCRVAMRSHEPSELPERLNGLLRGHRTTSQLQRPFDLFSSF